MTAAVLRGDARRLPLPDACADLIVTSPPYFGLRSYTDGGGHYDGQIGSEATPAEWVAALVDCTREWVRVLKPSGSIFVNLGDKYAGGGMGGHGDGIGAVCKGSAVTQYRRPKTDVPPKSLLGLPWRYALACMDELGLILRRDIIWSKPNGLPESVTDRCRSSHEYLFHFTVRPRYYAAVDEIREPHSPHTLRYYPPGGSGQPRGGKQGAKRDAGVWHDDPGGAGLTSSNPLGKLPGSVWEIPSQPLTVPAHLGVDHFAAFPMELPRRVILGWSPPGVCTECGEGRRPVRGVDWAKVPHTMTEKRALTRHEAADWCSAFADWCDGAGVSRADLDSAASTSDMGGWWASRLPHRAAVPTPEQWAKIRAAFDPPSSFNEIVHLTRIVPVAARDMIDVERAGRNRATGGGLGTPVMSITGYVCACTPYTEGAEICPACHCPVQSIHVGTSTTAVRGMRPADHGAERQTQGLDDAGAEAEPLLLEGMLEPAHSQEQGSDPGLDPHDQGLYPGADAGSPDGGQDRLRDAAPTGDGGTARADADSRRSGASPERHPGRQSPGQPYGDGKAGARQGVRVNQTAPDRLPLLRSRGSLDAGCPRCGSPPTRPSLVVDPFGGTGTTALVASMLGRTGVSVDLSGDYCRLARWRTTDPAERARALQVPKPPPVPDGQGSLFDDLEAS